MTQSALKFAYKDSVQTGEGKDGYMVSRVMLMMKCHECMVNAGGVVKKLIPPLPPGSNNFLLKQSAGSSSKDWLEKPLFKVGPVGVSALHVFILLVASVFAMAGWQEACGTETTSIRYDFVGRAKRNQSLMGVSRVDGPVARHLAGPQVTPTMSQARAVSM